MASWEINKGVGRTVEFKGLKAQYLFLFAGGGIGSYGRNVNQTAHRGVQGAYSGGKATAAGAGAAIGNIGGRIKGALIKGK